MTSQKKTETQNLFFSLQTRRLAKSFKDLNSSLAQWQRSYAITKTHENC